MYHPVTEKLPTFETRLRDVFCLRHDGRGVYTIFTEDVPIRTKHVRPYEARFTGINLFNRFHIESDSTSESHEDDYVEDSPEVDPDNVEGGSHKHCDEHNDDETSTAAGTPFDSFTNIPTIQSTYEECEGSGSEQDHSNIEYIPEEE